MGKDIAHLDILEGHWFRLMKDIGASEEDSTLYCAGLISLYSRGRHYHTTHHLVDLLLQADRLNLKDPVAVKFAIFYHDIVYGRESRQLLSIPEDSGISNESHSVALAMEQMKALGCSLDLRARVADLIMMTKTHHADQADMDAALFLDMDMSILGSPPARYARYAAQIRMEHPEVEDSRFGAGRLNFLRRTINDRFFMSDLYEKSHGPQARRNMIREMEFIERTGRPFGPQKNLRLVPKGP